MKIVHCFFTLEMGGAQVLAIDILNNMCVEHDTYLIIVNDIVSQALLKKLDNRVRVYRISRKQGSRNPWPLIKLNLILRKINPDIIHCHEYDIGRVIKAGVGRLIYTIHGMGISTQYYDCYKTLVAISDVVQEDVAHRLNRPIEKVYNGIDTSLFKKRTRYKVQGEKIKFVQVSRLAHEIKGQDILLKACQFLKNEYGFTNFTLDFVGIGPSMEYLKTLVDSLSLTKEVEFVGEKDRTWLSENLANYHLLVQPSRNEGFGLTLLEGFAAGLPVLASSIQGPAEIIKRTPRGFLFESENSEQCAEVLFQIFKAYENGKMEELMNSSEPITNKEYSIESCVKGYRYEYEQLIS